MQEGFFSKSSEASDVKSKSSRITENQAKTINILRKLAKKKQKERLEKLKLGRNQRPQIRPAEGEEHKREIDAKELGSMISTWQRKKHSLDTRMPLHVSKEAKDTLEAYKKKGMMKLNFSEGFVHGAKVRGITDQNKKEELGAIEVRPIRNAKDDNGTRFGLSIETDRDSGDLRFVFRQPATPGSLASPSQKDQGGLTTRLRGGK